MDASVADATFRTNGDSYALSCSPTAKPSTTPSSTAGSHLNVKYFKDTDTALLEFSDAPVDETREITPHVNVDLDRDGNLVSMTIEHASAATNLPVVRIEEIGATIA